MSVEKPEGKSAGELVTPAHGKGRLWRGPSPNHVPGPGRPPSKVKAALREDFDARRGLLNDIADGEVTFRVREKCPQCSYVGEPLTATELGKLVPSITDRIKALEVMAKFSDLEGDKIDRALIEELGEAVMAEVPDPSTVSRIRDRWVEIVARRIAGD